MSSHDVAHSLHEVVESFYDVATQFCLNIGILSGSFYFPFYPISRSLYKFGRVLNIYFLCNDYALIIIILKQIFYLFRILGISFFF